MKTLDAGYTAVIDGTDRVAWHDLMLTFDDASLFQTWSYGRLSWGDESLSHIVLKKDGTDVAMAQLRLVRIPFLRTGVAYVASGPLWKRRDEPVDLVHLRNMLRALYREYVVRRRYVLQVLPRTIRDDAAGIRRIFREEGFAWRSDPQQTVYVDLSAPLDEIRKGTRRKWRQTLQRAEKQAIVITEGSQMDIAGEAGQIIEEMKARKRYVEYGDMRRMIAVQGDLPDALKLRFALCKHEGTPVAVLAWFQAGKIGIPLVSATGNKGLELSASYPLYWRMIVYYKEHGFAWCDLGGLHRERNPGGYTFKTGLAGDACEVKNYIGQFEACPNVMIMACFRAASFSRSFYRHSRQIINRRLNDVRRRSGLPSAS